MVTGKKNKGKLADENKEKSFPAFEDLTENSSQKMDEQEENRREFDLEDKQPAGDSGPEDREVNSR